MAIGELTQTGLNETGSALSFPRSLPDFQRLFPDEAACASYLESARWVDGFLCQNCQHKQEPFRFANRPNVLRCRKCEKNTRLTAGTVMENSRIPLSTWFWGAYLMTSQTTGISALQFQRQLGLSRFETAFQMLHKLRAGMVRANQEPIGGPSVDSVEVDEVYIGGRTRGLGQGKTNQVIVAAAVDVIYRRKTSSLSKRRNGRFAGRLRMAVVPDRSASALCGFVRSAIQPGTTLVTDGWPAYNELAYRGYGLNAFPSRGNATVTEEHLPLIHLVFSNLKTWIRGTHHGVSPQHLQSYLNEFIFRFNRRFYPFNAFCSLLGIAGYSTSPTYEELYSGKWIHPNCMNRKQDWGSCGILTQQHVPINK